MDVHQYSEPEITETLTAVIAWAGNVEAARRYLQQEGKRAPASQTIAEWIHGKHSGMFAALRSEHAETQEQQLIHMLRDVAAQAVSVSSKAVEQAQVKLEAGKDQDPSRTAANLATVADKTTGKMLALSGRPTSIREDRNLNEIMRSLVAKGVLQLPEGEVEEGTIG
jgi:hypothetical protein